MRVQRVFATVLVAGVACLWALCAWSQNDAIPEEPPPPPPAEPGASPGEPPPMPQPAPGGDVLPPPQPEPAVPEEIVAPEPAPEPEVPAEVTPAPTRPTKRPTPVRPRITTKSRNGGRRAPALPGATGPSNPAPDIPPADTLPKDGGTPTEEVSFDFNNAALSDVVAAIGRMTGRNFDVDPTIAQTQVTVITHDKIPPEMAYQVLESLLSSRNFSMVETLGGKLIKIVPTGESPEKVPLMKGVEGVPPGYDTLSTHVVAVKYADASELTEILMKLGSKSLSITSYGRTNTLIITDTADGLRRVFKFLEEVDIPGYDTEMEIFTLEYSRAEVLAQQVQDVLMDTGGVAARGAAGQQGARGATPTRPATPTRLVRPTVPGQNAPTVVGSREETLRIVPDERLNAIIVIATASLMERVRDLVAKLDTPTPYEANNMNVYHLLNAPADKMEEALNALVGTTPRQASDKGGGAAPAGEVQPFEKKVAIKRYEQTNSLLILASPQDYKLIKEIIAQLDVPQRQVMVEAVIMDVSIQDTYGLSVDMASVTGNDAFALGNTSNISSLIDATKLADSLASGTAAITVAQSLLGLSKSGGMTAGAYHAIDVTVNGKEYKIPFVPFLIRALQTLTDIDILSKPSLATQDNKPADIIVGQEIPVPTQRSGYSYNPSSGTPTQNQQYNYGLTSYGRGISREDVGVKMKVTPHINEGDYVSIETEIEVSEATPSNVGIDANELGPTFNKNKITNNVVVKDGGTGVVAGLIKETVSHSGNQTPALSDVPLIGWLFRTRNDTRKKQNVVVLITPFIVKDSADLDRVTKYKMDEFRTQNADALFEEGFVKRIKKRHYMRTKHHPSIERSEEMTDEQRFGRGDVERP